MAPVDAQSSVFALPPRPFDGGSHQSSLGLAGIGARTPGTLTGALLTHDIFAHRYRRLRSVAIRRVPLQARLTFSFYFAFEYSVRAVLNNPTRIS